MKKYLFCLFFLALISIFGNAHKAAAYSVTVEKDSIYADAVPPNIMKNVETMFRKQVKKVMKSHNKYKDADDYTYYSQISYDDLGFIEKVKDLQEKDEVVIRYPFYIYDPDSAEYEWASCSYYFIAEKNHERICMFHIDVDDEDGKVRFIYDRSDDSYMNLDPNHAEETLFYWKENNIYAETPDQVNLIRDTDTSGGALPLQGNVVVDQLDENEFYQMSYEQKKDTVLQYLDDVKNGKVIKKSYKSMQKELGADYQQPNNSLDGTGEKTKSLLDKIGGERTVAIVVSIVCLAGAVIAGHIMTRQK